MSGARGSYGQHMHVYIYIHINIASSTHPACRDGHMLLTAAVNEDAIVIALKSFSKLLERSAPMLWCFVHHDHGTS